MVPEPLLSVFDFQEVELLLHGLPNIDMDDWIRQTEYTGDFNGQPNHKVVQWFWETVRGFEHEQKVTTHTHTHLTCPRVHVCRACLPRWQSPVTRPYSTIRSPRPLCCPIQAKLLQFVTGTSGVPVQGFAFLQGNDGNIRKFTIHGDKNVKVFPRAHTCFNRIDMPIYKNKAECVKYLTMAISMESTGFDIE